MAGIKISELSSVSPVVGTDQIPIARGLNTYKISVSEIFTPLTVPATTLKGNPSTTSSAVTDIALTTNSILARTATTIQNLQAGTNTVLCRLDSNSNLEFRSITESLITNNSITNAKLAQMAAYSIKLNNTNGVANSTDFVFADNSILVRNGSIVNLAATNNTILRKLDGVSTLEFGKVTTNLIDDNAINSNKLASGSVTNDKITDNTISGGKLSTNSVNLDRIQQIAGQSVLGNSGTSVGTVGAVKVTGDMLSSDIGLRFVPVGAIMMFSSQTIPEGWLACHGDVIPNGLGTVQGKTANFAPLYNLLGSTYGEAGKLPDLRGYFVRGFGTGQGSGDFGQVQNEMVGPHNHSGSGSSTSISSSTFNPPSNANQGSGWGVTWWKASGPGQGFADIMNPDGFANAWPGVNPSVTTTTTTTTTVTINNNTGTENRPKNISLIYIIKY